MSRPLAQASSMETAAGAFVDDPGPVDDGHR
jgi:hypothetical protein